MSFNLLTTPWLEVRRQSGARDTIAPFAITDDFLHDPIEALDFPRADWNCAVGEFLIGLVSLALPIDTASAWAGYFTAPPPPAQLAALLRSVTSFFDFDGPGACAFQDLDNLVDQPAKPVDALLIDAPGENTLRNNADLFVKRNQHSALSLPYAAAALITLQTYAPTGGTGHRTSLRGGGPLTTLVAPRRRQRPRPILWELIWANVPYAPGNTPFPKALNFPWLSPTKTSAQGVVVTPQGLPATHAFFACPRRIRLEFADGICAISKKRGRVCTQFKTRNYGANYLKWRHPLSPYYESKTHDLLAVHPRAGAFHYGDWLTSWGLGALPSQGVESWSERKLTILSELDPTASESIEVFGYDMDNMKARQWLQTSVPVLPRPTAGTAPLIQSLVAATEECARTLRLSCRIALYGRRDGFVYHLPTSLAADALRETGEQLWAVTQDSFLTIVRALSSRADLDMADIKAFADDWSRILRRSANAILNEAVDLEEMTEVDPRRLLFARDLLNSHFVKVQSHLNFAVAPNTAITEHA